MWRLAPVFVAGLGLASAAGRPELSGTWKLEGTAQAETLSIQQTENSVNLATTETDAKGKENKIEIRCGAMGETCKLKDGEVSLWYNGPVLVVMEKHHGNGAVIEKSYKLSDDGKKLYLEVAHIAPAQKTATYTFTRQ